MPQPLNPQGKSPWYPLDRRLVVVQNFNEGPMLVPFMQVPEILPDDLLDVWNAWLSSFLWGVECNNMMIM
jgi:hypothetical protein